MELSTSKQERLIRVLVELKPVNSSDLPIETEEIGNWPLHFFAEKL